MIIPNDSPTMQKGGSTKVTKVGWKICPKPLPSPPENAVTKTKKGCDCKPSWRYAGVNAEYCSNPDNDPYGLWCKVSDQSCQGNWWGYC